MARRSDLEDVVYEIAKQAVEEHAADVCSDAITEAAQEAAEGCVEDAIRDSDLRHDLEKLDGSHRELTETVEETTEDIRELKEACHRYTESIDLLFSRVAELQWKEAQRQSQKLSYRLAKLAKEIKSVINYRPTFLKMFVK